MRKILVTALVLIGSAQATAGSNWICRYQLEGTNTVRIEYVNFQDDNIVSLNHVNSEKRTRAFNFTILGLGTDILIKNEEDKPGYLPMRDWATVRAYSSDSRRTYFLNLKNRCAPGRTELCRLITVTDEPSGKILLNQEQLTCRFNSGGE